jgi:hypothetical protein
VSNDARSLISLVIKVLHVHIKSADADGSWNWRNRVHQHRGACELPTITGTRHGDRQGNLTHSHADERVERAAMPTSV